MSKHFIIHLCTVAIIVVGMYYITMPKKLKEIWVWKDIFERAFTAIVILSISVYGVLLIDLSHRVDTLERYYYKLIVK